MDHRPEGSLFASESNKHYISTADGLREALEKGITLEARAIVCTSDHDLIVELPCGKGIIPRTEGALGIAEGKTRDIALISRVNKIVCFKVTSVSVDESRGLTTAFLSRKAAQEECTNTFVNELRSGDIIDARVTHLEHFGCFVDIGCGIPSLIPIDAISVSRISHPSDRMRSGQFIRAVVKSNENGRICLSHKELLGTWDENAAAFKAGETVSGVVRSVEEYGIFVELTPNLAGLAELRDGIRIGDSVSVYIKAVIPEKMKVKLVIVDVCDKCDEIGDFDYFINESHIDHWVYSSDKCDKIIETVFDDE